MVSFLSFASVVRVLTCVLAQHSAAGSDSTASTMQSFVWHVLNDAKIHAKLVTEILDAPLSEIVQFKEGLALPYFQACLNETLRLKPAVGMNITRYIPPSGAEIADTWIPGGSQVAVNAWVLHRDTKVFGVDADSFNPERWFSEDKEHLKTMKRCMIHVRVSSLASHSPHPS